MLICTISSVDNWEDTKGIENGYSGDDSNKENERDKADENDRDTHYCAGSHNITDN